MSDAGSRLASELTRLALDVGREAAAMVLGRLGERVDVATKSSADDLVTEVDKASESLITELLLAKRPNDGVLGEEGTGIIGTSNVEWVIDPIDGTTSWVYGLPGFCVSIAARAGGQVVSGVVLAPASANEYTAVRNTGSTHNSRTASSSPITDLARSLVATGFSSNNARSVRQGAVFAQVIGHVRDLRRMGSAALDLAAVGTGQLDAYYEVGINPWDYEAGLLIAAEAGAETIVELDDVTGTAFVAAAAPGIASDFFALLERTNARQA